MVTPAAETCSRCGAPLVWADTKLVCPKAHCAGHQPHPDPKGTRHDR